MRNVPTKAYRFDLVEMLLCLTAPKERIHWDGLNADSRLLTVAIKMIITAHMDVLRLVAIYTLILILTRFRVVAIKDGYIPTTLIVSNDVTIHPITLLLLVEHPTSRIPAQMDGTG
jgi:hypothetical protein